MHTLKDLHSMWWIKAKKDFEYELNDRKTFNRQYLRTQEYDYEEDFKKIYKPQLDYWRPYLYEAINQYLGKPYILETYSDDELEKIVLQLNEAIKKDDTK